MKLCDLEMTAIRVLHGGNRETRNRAAERLAKAIPEVSRDIRELAECLEHWDPMSAGHYSKWKRAKEIMAGFDPTTGEPTG